MKKRLIVFLMLIASLVCLSVFATGCNCAPEVEKYTVSYQSESTIKGGVSGNFSSGSSIKKGTNFELRASANVGYEFAGWYEDDEFVSSSNPYSFNVTKNVEFVAKFAIKSFTLNYGVNNGYMGIVNCAISSGSNIEYNTSVTITATANTGYSFDKWYIAGTEQVVSESPEFTFNMPAQAYNLEARFVVNSYVLNIDYDTENCQVEIVSGSTTYNNGDAIPFGTLLTITATPNEGYDFIRWVEGGTEKTTQTSYSFNMPASQIMLSAITQKQIKTVKYISESVIIKTEQVEYGNYATMYQPNRANYEFIGWYLDANKTNLFDFSKTKITKDILLYAGWEEVAITYSVEFVDWNGKRIGSVQTVKEGLSAIIPASPEREGYDFDCWVCDGDYTNVQGNLIVVATYNVQTFVVNFYKDSQKTELYDSQEIEYNKLAKTPATITDIGEDLLFSAWIYGDGSEFSFETPIITDLDLIAKFIAKPEVVYEVKFFANGELIDLQYVAENSYVKVPTVIAPVGKEFNGWDKNVDTAIVDDVEFNAQFIAKTFKVSFVDFDQTIIDEQTIEYGNDAVAPSNPEREGYEFIGWDKEFNSVVEDLTITANYQALVYTATCYDGAQYIDQVTAEYGKAFAVPSTPEKEGFSFAGWYIDTEFTTKYDFSTIATGNISIYACFEEIVLETYTVEFFADGELISTQTVYSGKDAVAPGVPTKAGHTFTEWSVGFTNVTEDIEVHAIFTKLSYVVIFYSHDGQTLKNQTVLYGESATPPQAPSVEGKNFLRWSEDFSEVLEDMEIYAEYETQTIDVLFLDYDGTEITRVTVEYNGYVGIPKTPSKVGNIFKGWYVDSNLEEKFDFSTQITEQIELYADWVYVFDAFTVHFYVDGELYGNVQTVAEGKLVIEPGLPDGYTVWINRETGVAFDFDTPIVGNLILDALAE